MESKRKEQPAKLNGENKLNLADKRKYMKRGTSNDSMKYGTKNILITSDITISSIEQREDIMDQDDQSHSIISEEDSAFEDQTPAAKNTKMKKLPDFGNNNYS